MTNMDIVTRGDDEKIAYLEMENMAVMQDNRILAKTILKQEKLIEFLQKTHKQQLKDWKRKVLAI